MFDGVTVKVQYIGDEDHLLPTANNGTANGVIKSSQQLLLGLEERKKAAAEVTTVPLRQALSANYKNTAVTTVKNHSFIGSALLLLSVSHAIIDIDLSFQNVHNIIITTIIIIITIISIALPNATSAISIVTAPNGSVSLIMPRCFLEPPTIPEIAKLAKTVCKGLL